MRRSIVAIAAVMTLLGHHVADSQERILSLTLRGSYTTTSKVFYTPDSPSSDLRGQYFGIDNIYCPGFELRLNVPGQWIALTLETDYLSKSDEEIQLVGIQSPPRALPVREGFRVIPIELGASAYIPLGSDRVRLTMGGGLGAYFGKRYLTIAGVDAVQQNNPVTYGIHVETSFDYEIMPRVFVRADMRFRDPEFTTESRFLQAATQYGGVLILLPQDPFRARIDVNGLNFGLGLGVEIF
jgi:hypothetical protein